MLSWQYYYSQSTKCVLIFFVADFEVLDASMSVFKCLTQDSLVVSEFQLLRCVCYTITLISGKYQKHLSFISLLFVGN